MAPTGNFLDEKSNILGLLMKIGRFKAKKCVFRAGGRKVDFAY